MEWIQKLDEAILIFLQEHLQQPWLSALLVFLTTLGDRGLVWIGLGVLMLCTKKYRPCGITLLCALFLGFLCGNVILKPLIARPRPFTTFTEIELLIHPPGGYSFPSGHTLSSFAAAGVICYYHRRLGIAAGILAALIAFSRLYLFVHYPTDVITGALIGVLCAICAIFLVRFLCSRFGFGGNQS